MIRKATQEDIQNVADLYNKMIAFEDSNVKYTSWQKGIYPTADTARLGVKNDSLYVFEENGELLAAVILDTKQAPEYKKINWSVKAKYGEALVIHTLCVDPNASGGGIGSAMVDFAKQLAKEKANIEVDRKTVSLNAPINKIGEFTMLIKLTSKVKCELAISVSASEVVKESIEEVEESAE